MLCWELDRSQAENYKNISRLRGKNGGRWIQDDGDIYSLHITKSAHSKYCCKKKPSYENGREDLGECFEDGVDIITSIYKLSDVLMVTMIRVYKGYILCRPPACFTFACFLSEKNWLSKISIHAQTCSSRAKQRTKATLYMQSPELMVKPPLVRPLQDFRTKAGMYRNGIEKI